MVLNDFDGGGVQKPQPRRIEIMEPPGGTSLYKRFLDMMSSYRQFHITQDQYKDWFYAERGQQPQAQIAPIARHFVLPFQQFCLYPDPEWIDLSNLKPSDYLVERLNEQGLQPIPNKYANAFRPEGIAVNMQESGVCEFVSSYHLINDEREAHVVSAAYVNLSLDVPRNIHVARPLVEDKIEQAQIDKIASMNFYVILRFVDTMNHRKIKVIQMENDPFEPANRQQKRAVGWKKRDHYKVYIPATLSVRQAMQDVAEGKHLHSVSPHDRRAHLRRDKYGRKRIKVSESKIKGGSQGRFPIYDAYNVGMEGRDDDT